MTQEEFLEYDQKMVDKYVDRMGFDKETVLKYKEERKLHLDKINKSIPALPIILKLIDKYGDIAFLPCLNIRFVEFGYNWFSFYVFKYNIYVNVCTDRYDRQLRFQLFSKRLIYFFGEYQFEGKTDEESYDILCEGIDAKIEWMHQAIVKYESVRKLKRQQKEIRIEAMKEVAKKFAKPKRHRISINHSYKIGEYGE